ncbi:MAG: hypothetical protein AAGI52_13780 [Bacteroidota bacterium]
MVDLDRYREPSREPAVLEARRHALVEQMRWLIDEAEALGPLLAGIPQWAVDQAPTEDDLSIKETLAALAALDRTVYPGWLRAVTEAEEEPPAFETPDLGTLAEGANARDLDDLLNAVRAGRQPIADHVAQIPAETWGRPLMLDGEEIDLYGLVLAIVRRDADELKTLAYRLHGADLTQRQR